MQWTTIVLWWAKLVSEVTSLVIGFLSMCFCAYRLDGSFSVRSRARRAGSNATSGASSRSNDDASSSSLASSLKRSDAVASAADA